MNRQPISARQTLARNMRLRRADLKISQEKLAELCGLHRTYIGAVERSERNISIDNIEKISTALGMGITVILSE
ncbi:MAG: hypothetical protein COA52_15000 [Hyphomicrobiales bacterium]|nr:MAG: hypothetical protein COA52_15000 [Hyphomicrobiales bacterium]